MNEIERNVRATIGEFGAGGATFKVTELRRKLNIGYKDPVAREFYREFQTLERIGVIRLASQQTRKRNKQYEVADWDRLGMPADVPVAAPLAATAPVRGLPDPTGVLMEVLDRLQRQDEKLRSVISVLEMVKVWLDKWRDG